MYYVKIEGVNYEHADDKELTEEDVLDLALGNISEESNDSSKEPSSIAQYSTSQRTSYENNIGEISTNTPLVEDQCAVINIGTELPDTRRYAYVLFRGIGDDIQIGELVLQKNVRLGSTELGLLATVGLQIIHVFEKPRVVILSTDSNKIILMSALKDLNI
ncbi:unnamed protein product [Rotaria socialis]|uniref:Uncharacterized protein n=3 Tax=Rotaria socialis TaxID=392032 RepID=A0A821DG48_9BILA|nr:unnamed protein product [Rotaria socialis]